MSPNSGLSACQRRLIRDVHVGGEHPIRVQSMTAPATTEMAATFAQIARLVEAGCEIVPVTVPTDADADNLPNIRRTLKVLGGDCDEGGRARRDEARQSRTFRREEKDVPTDEPADRPADLIRTHGKWLDPEPGAASQE